MDDSLQPEPRDRLAITPAMLRAGLKVLWDSGVCIVECEGPDLVLIEEILVASLGAAPDAQTT